METLWAPWRMAYIGGAKPVGCVFCPMQAESDDRAQTVLWRGKTVFCVLNRYPYATGHVMCVPYVHGAHLHDLPLATLTELMWLTAHAVMILQTTLAAQGCNAGLNLGRVAGGSIEGHIHMHVVPRWEGDHNFLPVLSDTKSLPEYLDATYDRLLPAFRALQPLESLCDV